MDGARRTGTQTVEVRLLGSIEALRDGSPVALGGPKPRTLLAVLALDLGRVVSVDRLVEALWPGDAPDTAPHAVQVYVSQLRKALGPSHRHAVAGLRARARAGSVDLHRFTRLAQEGREAYDAGSPENAEATYREALALWRGPALADFLYEPFAQTEIARLEELRTVVLEERVEADLALGRHAELVAELEALAQAQPLPRASARSAHARALPLRPAGRRARCLPRRARDPRRRARHRARPRAQRARGGDPPPGRVAASRRGSPRQAGDAVPPARHDPLRATSSSRWRLPRCSTPRRSGGCSRRYFETVSAALTRHGGTVEKFAGDAVMAAFGIPISHEDDALRAARAALDIRAGMAALNEQLVREHGVGLEVRIGIETGEVVATPTDDAAAARHRRSRRRRRHGSSRQPERARSSSASSPARLIDHAARLEPLGALEIKGKREPIRAFRLARDHARRARVRAPPRRAARRPQARARRAAARR